MTTFAAVINSAAELASLLTSYKSYQANFKQTLVSDDNNQTSSGILYMQRPGKFRWEVRQPNKQIIIANDNTLWIYDVDLAQVTKQKLDLQSANNPALLLSGDVAELIKRYEVKKIQNNEGVWYQLTPRNSQSSFVLIRMKFDKNRLVSIWVKNNLGQTTLFQFSNIQLNIPLSASLFHFKVPAGVDVLQ